MDNKKISFDELKRIIVEDTRTSAINYPAPSAPIQPFVVHTTDDKAFLRKYGKEIFGLIQDAYAGKGGFGGADSPKGLIRDTDRAKLVFDQSGKIIACALYRTDLGGVKRFGSAGIPNNKESLKAVNAIIKTDIEPYDGWYWVEASEIIEKLFKKNGGNPIPNTLARFFLNIDEDNQDFELVDGDPVHYTRTIKGKKRQKMIFGFKDEESMIAAKNAVADFAEFKIQINKMDKRIMESDDKISQSLKEAKTFLSRLYDLHYEWDCDEMLPEWHKRLLDSQSLIRKNIGKIPESEREMYLAAVKRGDACREDMTILRFKRFSVK